MGLIYSILQKCLLHLLRLLQVGFNGYIECRNQTTEQSLYTCSIIKRSMVTLNVQIKQ